MRAQYPRPAGCRLFPPGPAVSAIAGSEGSRSEAERSKKASPLDDDAYLWIDMLSGFPWPLFKITVCVLPLRLHELT